MNDWTLESRFFDQSSDVKAKSYSLNSTNQNTKAAKISPDEKKLPSNSMQNIEIESVEQRNNDDSSSKPSQYQNCQYQKSPKRRCWICNEVGHQKKDCPINKRNRKTEKKPENRNKSIQCFNCNEFGHFARNCHLADRINDNSSPVETRG